MFFEMMNEGMLKGAYVIGFILAIVLFVAVVLALGLLLSAACIYLNGDTVEDIIEDEKERKRMKLVK